MLTRHKDDFVYVIVNDALCNGIKSTGIKRAFSVSRLHADTNFTLAYN